MKIGMLKRLVIAQHERALLLEDRDVIAVLEPGVHWLADPLGRKDVLMYDIARPEFAFERIEVLLKAQPELVARHFTVVELGDREIGVVYKDGKLAAVLPAATRALYWKGPIEVRVEVIDIEASLQVPAALADVLVRGRAGAARGVGELVVPVEVAENSIGLLYVNGAFVQTLAPGLHAFWKVNRGIKVETVDLRLTSVDVSGQEILTRDKVSLRLNVSATYRVTDAVAARTKVKDYGDELYRTLQFALRQAVGARTLDALLADKSVLDQGLLLVTRERMAELGIEVAAVGVKDVILPGEMKEILNRVVLAEKEAQANLIKRREETAATRSLLNTARLMEENRVLLRLKELEKVDKLTVFGGLEGVLRDTVRIDVQAP
jgi:regulator of protease activity HflC (stomatin/prohibitin superfamily)